MLIKYNIGKTDKWIRIILGIILVAISYCLKSWLLSVVGIIIFSTGITNWCLFYKIFGISTCKIKKVDEDKKASEKNK